LKKESKTNIEYVNKTNNKCICTNDDNENDQLCDYCVGTK